LTGIVTQGNENLNSWVETYTVQHSHDGKAWNPVLDSSTRLEKVILLCECMQLSVTGCILIEVSQTGGFQLLCLVT